MTGSGRQLAGAAALIVAAVLLTSLAMERRAFSPGQSLFAAALGTAGLVLALGALLPAALLLFGGPRRWVLVSAFVLWAVGSGAALAVLWTRTAPP